MTQPRIFKLSWQDLRGSWRGFRLFMLCLALGVGVIAGVGSLGAMLQTSIQDQARSILGGDLKFQLTSQEFPAEATRSFESFGTLSKSYEQRAMASTADNAARSLIEFKPVDQLYPLYGRLETASGQDHRALLAPGNDGSLSALVAPELLDKLGLSVGDSVLINDQAFTIRDTIRREPDRAVSAFSLGPRVMVRLEDAEAHGLILPGSLNRTIYKLKLDSSAALGDVLGRLETEFPRAIWQTDTYLRPAPGMERFLDQISRFLVLVGLATLLIGGVGIYNAAAAYFQGKLSALASLKAIGATRAHLIQFYSFQIFVMSVPAILIGLVFGTVIPLLAAWGLQDIFPFDLIHDVHLQPLLLAAVFGALVTFLFTYAPLQQALAVRASDLFRASVRFPPFRWTGPHIAILSIPLMLLIALVFLVSPDPGLAAGFMVAVAVAFLFFFLAGHGLRYLAGHLKKRLNGSSRLALANLARPQNQTGTLLLSIGLGLTVLAAVQLIDANFRAALESELPENAPALFFIDIQQDQVTGFDEIIKSVAPGARLNRVPSLRGRIVAVDGVDIENVAVNPEIRWAVESDRGVTYLAAPPEKVMITQGQWWPETYQGNPLFSVDERLIAGFGTRIGGTITLNILGRDITGTIASGRAIDWQSLGINFTFIVSPGVLESAPQTHIATVSHVEGLESEIVNAVNRRYPNVSGINVRQALEDAGDLMRSIAIASQLIGAVSLIAGLLVLSGAMRASHERRLQETVILKVLGARRRQILGIEIQEYLWIAAFAVLIAALVGTLSAWGFAQFMLFLDWVFVPGALVLPFTLGLAVIFALSLGSSWRILRQRAAASLREL